MAIGRGWRNEVLNSQMKRRWGETLLQFNPSSGSGVKYTDLPNEEEYKEPSNLGIGQNTFNSKEYFVYTILYKQECSIIINCNAGLRDLVLS
jgi:hypothetical protein